MMTNEKEQLLARLKGFTPARIGVGRTGTRPLTADVLAFRTDHAAAVDAVYSEVDHKLLEYLELFSVDTKSTSKEHYLKFPDQGRLLSEIAKEQLKCNCRKQPDVQIVVSDGLSANAIEANIRDVYPALVDSLGSYDLSVGTSFFVKGGRVACMDDIGDILAPKALVLLIGERPGLVSAESMSAYMCYQPQKGKKESDRMVISNIHRGGTPPLEAAAHIGTVIHQMIQQQTSGVHLVI
ncbi:ethanolamine ammonia-lyase [Priestia aryabhattai]|uniref:ethanolamine ammonia-lyase subunit EutC n=1 Tax=Bacillaceae TaxID=186817 RepID=UPI000BA0DD43|nr:ethanolamine ammonia-lyase subunit EutC [Bacillus sp. CBEL-1]OZT13709.1 ethanolamine ammonia-lyase [Priestia aryabhattai]TDB49758.1 ethanolamine ammonia-lyase subunit EutC [Bacillus sp. CBEL-1]